ncbi:ScbA/BarX family gamma-butyrolactone biosynthesis protein [Streptomyces sp. NBC_00356]|uniref:ScbA/BarX family gamma-butyrolactone biosynthesis protein n=1 Tax=Streptomyces sp. NBC_00356 TaxID=2975724 RepID=UPI002E26A83D
MTVTTVASAHLSTTPDQPTAIPRHWVHKAAQAEVLLCGWEKRGDDSFVIPAQWPRSHSFYTPVRELHDPMFFAESVRQAIPLVSHAGYDAPLDHRQIWDHFRCTLTPEALHHNLHPVDCQLVLTCVDVVRRANRLGGLTMHVTAVRNGRRLGVATTRFTSQGPAVYRRLRGPRADTDLAMSHAVPLPAPLAPEELGRVNPQDVVLAPGKEPGHWQLRVDVTHPVLFDHPVDHIPGMLLLEAARQAAHATLQPQQIVLAGIDSRFNRFVEFDTPCWIEAEREDVATPGRVAVRVTARQGDQIPFTATVTAAVDSA